MDRNLTDFKEIEEKCKKLWEKEGIYQFDLRSKKEIYSIDTPPPTVSGRMHIGHACSYSQQDFIVRFMRMSGFNVFYPFGTDDNGLPTERLVEKRKGIKSKDMPRGEFIKLCIDFLKEEIPAFTQDWKDIGMSCDFDMSYSTIDDNTRKISQKSFIELLRKKEIYKKEFPTIWCSECMTAIAQAELEDKEEKSLFLTIKFSCDGKNLLIATTRPELLGACIAVFVHPSDKRYKNLAGKKAKVPLFNHEVPIIADESADPEKGTGALMVCSYGDRFDVDAINRHKLIPKIILSENGALKISPYQGLKTKEARKKILEDLKNKNFITEQKEISHIVNVHDKCGTPIEFILTEQWFIKILDKRKKLIEQGNKIKWHPEFMYKRYDNWVKGLEWDWGISRERYFGVPIPVWECKKCSEIILPDEKELPVDPLRLKKKCPKCGNYAVPEKKVLDTWATSSLTPQIASSVAGERIKIPFSLRPQAHDIIRTWAFYTIVKSYLHEGKIPWKNIVISGNVSLGGEKMSKSKGNVINPKDILQKYGADALRYWAASPKLGEDFDYQEKDLVTGKKLINKLLNASKFVFMNLKDYKGGKPKKLEPLDELFLGTLNYQIKLITEDFKDYNYSMAKSRIENLFWDYFCDNYLEIVKKRVYEGRGNERVSAQYTLYKSLLTILKMLAPIMPFITEDIYQTYFRKTEKYKSIHISEWPEYSRVSSSNDFLFFRNILSLVRKEKTNNKKSMNAECIIYLPPKNKKALEKKELMDDFKNVTNAEEIKEGNFNVEYIK